MPKKTGKKTTQKTTKPKAKAKAKVKAKAKAKPKGSEEQNTTPKLVCSLVAECNRPHTTESSGKLATKVTEVLALIEEWTTNVRKAFLAKTALPIFAPSKFVNPNANLMSRAASEKMEDSDEIGLPRYNPVLTDLIHAQHCTSLRRSSKLKEQPEDWDEKAYGPWYHEYEGEDPEPSGWYLETRMPRRCHAEKAEHMIDEPDKNILSFGNLRIVCGSGTHDEAACFKIWQTSHGNYRAGDATRKRMSLAGIKEIRDVVFRIEDRTNNGGGVTVKGKWKNVREMVYLPGQVLTAGFLFTSNDKQLTAKEILGLDADTKGLKFKALDAPIIGKAIHWSKLWAEIQSVNRAAIKAMKDREGRSQEYESGNPQTKSITNILVHGKRVDPSEEFPFGLKGSQMHQVAYLVADGNGSMNDGCFSMGVVIGDRSNIAYNKSVNAVKQETEAPKKSKKKSKDDAAPPMDVTADEAETVKA